MLPGEDQMRLTDQRGARVARHLRALPQQFADLPLFDAVFVQVAGVVVDDVQVAVTQQPNAQGLAVQFERH
ncbi:hypothetical protein D3C73_1352760 [compost metagenome]